jgi:hypothetical protein
MPKRKEWLRWLPVEAPEVGQMLAYLEICRIRAGVRKFIGLRDLLDFSQSHLLALGAWDVNITAIRIPNLR